MQCLIWFNIFPALPEILSIIHHELSKYITKNSNEPNAAHPFQSTSYMVQMILQNANLILSPGNYSLLWALSHSWLYMNPGLYESHPPVPIINFLFCQVYTHILFSQSCLPVSQTVPPKNFHETSINFCKSVCSLFPH